MTTHNLETSVEALGKGLAAHRCLPGIRQGRRGIHGSQADAMLARAWVPPQRLSLAQNAELLRAEPAGVEIHTLGARHFNSE